MPVCMAWPLVLLQLPPHPTKNSRSLVAVAPLAWTPRHGVQPRSAQLKSVEPQPTHRPIIKKISFEIRYTAKMDYCI